MENCFYLRTPIKSMMKIMAKTFSSNKVIKFNPSFNIDYNNDLTSQLPNNAIPLNGKEVQEFLAGRFNIIRQSKMVSQLNEQDKVKRESEQEEKEPVSERADDLYLKNPVNLKKLPPIYPHQDKSKIPAE